MCVPACAAFDALKAMVPMLKLAAAVLLNWEPGPLLPAAVAPKASTAAAVALFPA